MRGRAFRGAGRPGAPAALALHASNADAEGAKQHWVGLDADVKLRALIFDDPRLVEQVVRGQTQLRLADIQCYALGIRGQEARSKVGVDQFVLECDPEQSKPVAFSAKPEFVNRTDFFEYLEEHLGTPFLKGRPVAPRREWHNVFEPVASSWADFMRQVLRLVELAVLHAFNCAKAEQEVQLEPREELTEEAIAAVEAELMDAEGSSQSQGSKKKNKKKKKNKLSKDCDSFTAVLHDCPEESPLTEELLANAPISLASASDETQRPWASAAGRADGREDDVASISTMDTASIPIASGDAETTLKVDWNSAEPPVQPAVETTVELQVDWSEDAANTFETRWSAWLSNGLAGVAAEWEWVATERAPEGSIRAHVKNTFVEMVEPPLQEDARVRAKSLPASNRMMILG